MEGRPEHRKSDALDILPQNILFKGRNTLGVFRPLLRLRRGEVYCKRTRHHRENFSASDWLSKKQIESDVLLSFARPGKKHRQHVSSIKQNATGRRLPGRRGSRILVKGQAKQGRSSASRPFDTTCGVVLSQNYRTETGLIQVLGEGPQT